MDTLIASKTVTSTKQVDSSVDTNARNIILALFTNPETQLTSAEVRRITKFSPTTVRAMLKDLSNQNKIHKLGYQSKRGFVYTAVSSVAGDIALQFGDELFTPTNLMLKLVSEDEPPFDLITQDKWRRFKYLVMQLLIADPEKNDINLNAIQRRISELEEQSRETQRILASLRSSNYYSPVARELLRSEFSKVNGIENTMSDYRELIEREAS